jgi:hypothetical protein
MDGTLKRRVVQWVVFLLTWELAGINSLRAAPTPQGAAGQSEVAVGSSTQQQLISFLAAHMDIYSELLKQPNLIRDKSYLQHHPELAAFVKEHPEIAQRPSFTGGLPISPELASSSLSGDWHETLAGPCGPALKIQALQYELERARSGGNPPPYGLARFIDDVGPFAVLVTFLGAFLWVLKVILENRRWGKVANVQSEVHSKLLEKLGNSQDLLAYMGTEPGKRFLESQPFQLEAEAARPTPYPFGRILLSVQLEVD